MTLDHFRVTVYDKAEREPTGREASKIVINANGSSGYPGLTIDLVQADVMVHLSVRQAGDLANALLDLLSAYHHQIDVG